MATVHTKSGYNGPGGVSALVKSSEQSAANTALTVNSPGFGRPTRLIGILCTYSAAPTHAGVELNINSGLGAAYDGRITISAANTQKFSLFSLPTAIIDDTDAWEVVAPAGGAGITSTITIYCEEL